MMKKTKVCKCKRNAINIFNDTHYHIENQSELHCNFCDGVVKQREVK